jgi:putative DNA modification/repair radical SAM protein
MDRMQKLEILGEAAKYDVSCSSSGNGGRQGKFGNTAVGGICHAWTGDGRCISLLKVLLTNRCMYRCEYCAVSAARDIPRAAFEPEELAEITEAFYRRNYIEGLFLSSAVQVSPDHTMERMAEVASLLRARGFGGYIHIKGIPGASAALIEKTGRLADRMSINIELPSERSLLSLAPDKNARAILQPMGQISGLIAAEGRERRTPAAQPFVPAGQSTQLIVGASPESDLTILRLSEALYRKYTLKRVYYSAFMPVPSSRIAPLEKPPLLREHRLYQADWLLRFYGFQSTEILEPGAPSLDLELDPKSAWALRHPEFFPVDVARAPLRDLLRVPGIGQISAQRLLQARRFGGLTLQDVRACGVVMKRASYFITCRGAALPDVGLSQAQLRLRMLPYSRVPQITGGHQLSMFEPDAADAYGALALQPSRAIGSLMAPN